MATILFNILFEGRQTSVVPCIAVSLCVHTNICCLHLINNYEGKREEFYSLRCWLNCVCTFDRYIILLKLCTCIAINTNCRSEIKTKNTSLLLKITQKEACECECEFHEKKNVQKCNAKATTATNIHYYRLKDGRRHTVEKRDKDRTHAVAAVSIRIKYMHIISFSMPIHPPLTPLTPYTRYISKTKQKFSNVEKVLEKWNK